MILLAVCLNYLFIFHHEGGVMYSGHTEDTPWHALYYYISVRTHGFLLCQTNEFTRFALCHHVAIFIILWNWLFPDSTAM